MATTPQPVYSGPSGGHALDLDHIAGERHALSSYWVTVGSAGLGRAACVGPTGLVSSRRRIEPGVRFSRTRLTDILDRRHSGVSLATAGWVVAR